MAGKRRAVVLVYVSTTYSYFVPEGESPEDYRLKVEAGEVDPDDEDSRTQGSDLYWTDQERNYYNAE